MQNAKVDEINLVYRCETQTSHIGGGGQSLPADFYTLKIVKASTDDFCKVAANMIKRDYLVNVRINPEDAISRVQIPYPDIRLNPVTAPGIENVVRNLVPEEKVITVMGMIRTGRSSDYSVCDFTLFKNTKYKIEIRHPNYQFTEATFTVPDHESTISFLIGDKGSKVRVVFE